MHCFYVGKDQIEEEAIRICGDDVNHIKNVLRMKQGDRLFLCDKEGTVYTCGIEAFEGREIRAGILEKQPAQTELPVKIFLFQGIPKKDKMELIVQKAVELGVYEIIPVACRFCVAKIGDQKKEIKKRERWQAIAEAAAKQSGRGTIPNIHEIMNVQEALSFAEEMDAGLIPYERAEDGMKESFEIIKNACKGTSIAVFIGPEGGFSKEEITAALKSRIRPVSLGKRILRTETAGLAVLSVLMFEIEKQREE